MASPDFLYAPHGEPGKFFNPWQAAPPVGFGALLRWKLEKNEYDKRRSLDIQVVANDGAYLKDGGQPPSATWVGHSTFAIQDGGDVVLTDPHWGARALLPPRLSPPGIPLGSVPGEAFAVLSHNHYDHLDAWTVRQLPATTPWFVPLGLAQWFAERGRKRVVELDWWQSVRHGRWTLTCLPAQHWSNRLGMARNASLWCSWLLDSGERRYYFAGDSGYYHGFAEIGRRFPGIDVAFLPIGAYEPRWFMRYQHVDPAEAYQAFLDLGARTMIPMHWGCFDLTNEPADLAPKVLARVLEERGADRERVRILAVGERWGVE
ncbi:MAG TPA: MBL fold metallo-hydrolase [Thermoanaerobaculia bacterium]|jgi:N-acyl-phosphatidylethanolamine-hydrolysing phospholipase D|nr:MBL fold metallo-hydrolase [Thermoanaerobaculia bacterium]